MTCLYLGEAALMVAIPADLLSELLDAATVVSEMHDGPDCPPEYAEARLYRAIEAVAALEENR
jgi:hypothetical protein